MPGFVRDEGELAAFPFGQLERLPSAYVESRYTALPIAFPILLVPFETLPCTFARLRLLPQPLFF